MEQRDLSGILFKNQRKEKETHADYQGSCMINGEEFYMNAWLKDGKNGKFMSFAFKSKGDKPKEAPKKAEPEFDDDIPW